MSHFSLGVITRKKPTESELENLLAPYDEHLEVEAYVGQTREEFLKEYRERLKEEQKKYDELVSKGNLKDGPKRFTNGEFFKELRANDDELIEILRNYYSLDEEGNRISTYNPDSKWDWYCIGGRWGNSLLVINGAPVDSAQIKDILWESMADGREKASAFWDAHVEGKGKKSSLYSPEYFKRTYQTKEKYVELESCFRTFALLTPNGEWVEEGEMGWFGISSTTTESLENYVDLFTKTINKPEYQDYWFTIVDCHI